MLHAGWELPTFKLFAILVFLLFTAPVSSYALANAALLGGLKPKLRAEGASEEGKRL